MRRQKICYLSGKISGLGRETYLARFAHAEEILKREGFAVINPTKFAPCRWPWLYNILGYELTLLYDLWHLWRRADRIFLIPGWQDSQGARIESFTAHVLGIYQLPHGKKDELEKEMKEWMEKYEADHELQPPPRPKFTNDPASLSFF